MKQKHITLEKNNITIKHTNQNPSKKNRPSDNNETLAGPETVSTPKKPLDKKTKTQYTN